MSKAIDLTGTKVNRLTAISKAYRDKHGHWYWNCKCDCGNETIVAGCNLRDGRAKSCGCWKSDRAKKLNKTHGKKNENIYNVWGKMKQRCNNPQYPDYKNYGGRGISVCEKWNNDFQAFYDDVSKLPHFGEKGYTLDRIDVNGNYEPNNCRWATAKEQSNNRRNNHLLTYKGETHTLQQWSEIRNINYVTLSDRLKRGWSIERALEFTEE